MEDLDMERGFKDMRFFCKAYSQLVEEAVPGDVYNIFRSRFVRDLLSQLTIYHRHGNANQIIVRNNGIRPLCGNQANLSALCDTFRRMLGVARTSELSA